MSTSYFVATVCVIVYTVYVKKAITTCSSSFPALIQNNYLYVDKTEYIYNLISKRPNNYYFVSRPRRFGKSLMCSTLKALFEGKRELFKGLYIDSTDYDFKSYPVLYFNFANLTVSRINSFEAFNADFQDLILNNAIANGIDDLELAAPSTMMRRLLRALNKDVVIIIDEYDTPLIKASEYDWVDYVKSIYTSFFETIKNTFCPIKLLYVTGIVGGITEFINSIDDISLDSDISGMFGYSDDEVEKYFSSYIADYKECGYKTREEFVSDIKDYYSGYQFSCYDNLRVYNPVSINSFFDNRCIFDNYWWATAPGSATAIDLIKKFELYSIWDPSEKLYSDKYYLSRFDATNIKNQDDVIALLYFSGYLTIKKSRQYSFVLDFPTMEVRKTFANDFLRKFCDFNSAQYLFNARKSLLSGDFSAFVDSLNGFYSKHPYSCLNYDSWYCLAFYSIFMMIYEAGNRIFINELGVELSIDNDVYTIEMKVDKSADDAISQIKEKRYFDKYEGEKKVHLIGLSFSSKEKLIEDWKEEIL